MTTKPELSDSELIEKCKDSFITSEYFQDLLTRFEKLVKENEQLQELEDLYKTLLEQNIHTLKVLRTICKHIKPRPLNLGAETATQLIEQSESEIANRFYGNCRTCGHMPCICNQPTI